MNCPGTIPDHSVELAGDSAKNGKFTVGTLTYSRAGLISLFGWLLWGDFIFTLMESVMPALLPILLKEHGASNREIAVIASTLFLVMNSVLNPVISYQSDRFRSRWGRRRPFIFLTTPFVVLFLIAVPFAPEILSAIQQVRFIEHLLLGSSISPIILVFGFLVAGFQVFNMFISSVYYYLIPDVVPLEFIGRFYGLFRVFGALAAIIFNYFLLGLAEAHMREIFVLTAVVYGVFIMLMCWRVKEGQYPPPATEPQDHWWRGIQNYLKECYGHSYYWWVFLAYSALGWGAVSNVFNVFFFCDELGFSLELFGQANAWTGFILMILAYPFGMLMDRWGCHKTLIVSLAGVLVSSLLMYFFTVGKISGLIWYLLRSVPLALSGLAMAKWTIEVYPRERYGQFGSAGALFASVGGIVAALVYSWLLDWTKAYRCFLLWNSAFTIVALIAVIAVYRRWRKLGGPDHYSAP